MLQKDTTQASLGMSVRPAEVSWHHLRLFVFRAVLSLMTLLDWPNIMEAAEPSAQAKYRYMIQSPRVLTAENCVSVHRGGPELLGFW
jgi:hypothetical protein